MTTLYLMIKLCAWIFQAFIVTFIFTMWLLWNMLKVTVQLIFWAAVWITALVAYIRHRRWIREHEPA